MWITVAVFALDGALLAGGMRFLAVKTAVLPVMLGYGLLVRHRAAFVRDWLPFLSAVVLFDALRGAIYGAVLEGFLSFHAGYVVVLERAIVGLPSASLLLQAFRAPAVDLAAILLHASHFGLFLLFGLALWHLRRDHFGLFRRAFVLAMAVGLIGYAAIPTAPPWLAAQFDAVPPVPHVVERIYTSYVPELYGMFATNPVAAMPSLHAAFPAMCAAIGWRAFGKGMGIVLGLYAVLVMLALVYLGEHYAVDVVAGVAVAALALGIGRRTASVGLSPRGTLMASVGAVALTYTILALSRAVRP